jgi:hypothetical protein
MNRRPSPNFNSARDVAGQYIFPDCLVRTFEQSPRAKTVVAGSWYHNEEHLPYYIWVTVREDKPPRDSEPPRLIFNLRTAEPIIDKPYFERVCPGKKMADGWRRTSGNWYPFDEHRR